MGRLQAERLGEGRGCGSPTYLFSRGGDFLTRGGCYFFSGWLSEGWDEPIGVLDILFGGFGAGIGL